VAEVDRGEKPVKEGEEPSEGRAVELNLPELPIKRFSWIRGGVATQEATGLSSEITITSRPTLELASGENWGVFYTL
jgi:hypothetical protein